MSFKNFDIYPKLSDEFRVKTVSGAAISIIAIFFIIYLFLSELSIFMNVETVSKLFVDIGRGEKIAINFDITFPYIPCSLLGLDAMDVAGSHQLDVKSEIKKQILNSRGEPDGGEIKHELKSEIFKRNPTNATDPRTQPNYCGSCYGAESEPVQCCNTCQAVKDQYIARGWALPPLTNIDQCVLEGVTKESFLTELEEGQGCRIYGHLQVNKVAGNFHYAPGRSFQHAHMHVHDLASIAGAKFNLTHTINSLSFGDEFPGMRSPLDGVTRYQTADTETAMFMSYIKVVPTNYVSQDGSTLSTNQFSVTEHYRSMTPQTGQGLPGVFFFYELSPIKLQLEESKMSLGHFLVQLCAILGGVYAVAGMIDRILYSAARHVERKRQQGKLF